MAVTELRVSGYRSIRDVTLPLTQINVLVGPNGCGKSNLYQAMYLLHAAAGGQLARTLAAEGGMPSVLWAGDRKKGVVRMRVGVTLGSVIYDFACGLPGANELPPAFSLDPSLKEESVSVVEGRRRTPVLERGAISVWARDSEGRRASYPMTLSRTESVLSQLREPHRFPQLSTLREEMLGWRFYHQFRTDADALLRHPQVGVWTPILSHDGSDLAAALETIRSVGEAETLDEAVDNAFPGGRLFIESSQARFHVLLQMPGIKRPFDARELSDGTLRYLCLLAALLSPRPTAVLALNEPETSLHPDLLDPLAYLIVRASRHSQLWITTHSEPLAYFIERHSGVSSICLEKVNGETRVVGQPRIDVRGSGDD